MQAIRIILQIAEISPLRKLKICKPKLDKVKIVYRNIKPVPHILGLKLLSSTSCVKWKFLNNTIRLVR